MTKKEVYKKEKKTSTKVDKKNKNSDNSWTSTESQGGDFKKLEEGDALGRIRSVISLGEVKWEFGGKLSDKASAAVGVVIEAYNYSIKKDKIKLKDKEPAIMYLELKYLKGNPKSGYAKLQKSLGFDTPDELVGMTIGFEVGQGKTRPYIKGQIQKTGLSERKSTPELVGKSHIVPNLSKMTVEALKELNPYTQVHSMLLRAIDYPNSIAETCVNLIRKDKPDFALFDDNSSKKNKKGKKNKKPKNDSKNY